MYRVRVRVRVGVRVTGCLSGFSARGYKNYLEPAGQIGAPVMIIIFISMSATIKRRYFLV